MQVCSQVFVNKEFIAVNNLQQMSRVIAWLLVQDVSCFSDMHVPVLNTVLAVQEKNAAFNQMLFKTEEISNCDRDFELRDRFCI